jgi:hypothetical protein
VTRDEIVITKVKVLDRLDLPRVPERREGEVLGPAVGVYGVLRGDGGGGRWAGE